MGPTGKNDVLTKILTHRSLSDCDGGADGEDGACNRVGVWVGAGCCWGDEGAEAWVCGFFAGWEEGGEEEGGGGYDMMGLRGDVRI